MKHLLAYSSAALLVALSFTACGGDSFESGDGDSTGDGDSGDGDGDATGTGGTTTDTGGTSGDGDTTGDGDMTMCTTIDVYGLNVIVRGGASVSGSNDAAPAPLPTGGTSGLILPPDPGTGGSVGTSDCAAIVTATDGEYQETLECSVEGLDCKCLGASERPGTYTVAATLGALVDSEPNVLVEADECHVIGKTVTLFD